MLTITIKEETSVKDLSNAYKNLRKMYEESRDNALDEIRAFLREHKDAAFTAQELSEASGLSVQTIALAFRYSSQIGHRARYIHTTYVRMNKDGSIDYDHKIDHRTEVNEYFWRMAY